MPSLSEIVAEVSGLLAGKISLDEFEDWSADAVRGAHTDPNRQARELLFQIRTILNAHDDNDANTLTELAEAT